MANRGTGTATTTRNTINLRGSTEIVTEFFGFAINSILYQRGIYNADNFEKVSRYGLPMLVSNDEGLKTYLGDVLRQLTDWLLKGQVRKLVVCINNANTQETIERWQFNVETDRKVTGDGTSEPDPSVKFHKSQNDIHNEIQAIIRQITASVTFLPLIEEPCIFDILIHTSKETDVPRAWEESENKGEIQNKHEVKLRSFTTKIHKVDGLVSYKYEPEEEEPSCRQEKTWDKTTPQEKTTRKGGA